MCSIFKETHSVRADHCQWAPSERPTDWRRSCGGLLSSIAKALPNAEVHDQGSVAALNLLSSQWRPGTKGGNNGFAPLKTLTFQKEGLQRLSLWSTCPLVFRHGISMQPRGSEGIPRRNSFQQDRGWSRCQMTDGRGRIFRIIRSIAQNY